MSSSILKNITWLSFGNLLVKPLWFVFILVIAVQVLGTEGYGTFTAVLFLAAIAGAFSDLGLAPYTIREVARRRSESSTFFSTFLVYRSLIGALTLLVGILVGLSLGYEGMKLEALIYAGIYTTLLGLTEYCRTYYRAFERLKYEALSIITEKALVMGAGLALLLTYRTPDALLGGMALGMFVVLIVNVSWTHLRLAPLKRDRVRPSLFKKALPAALPLGLAGQFVVIYFRTDAVMVDAIAGEHDAGLYAAAYRFLEASVLTTVMVSTVIYPRLSRHFHDKSLEAFMRLFRRSTLVAAGIGLCITLVLFGLSDGLIHLIQPDGSLAPSAGALRILAWVAPFMCVNNMMAVTSSASDDQNWLAAILGTAAVLNITLNFIVIPQYSFYGACVSTLITEILITSLLAFRFRRHMRLLTAAS